MNKLALISLVAFALLSTSTFATGDAAKGKIKSVTCIACHGVDGNSVAPIFPKLAGQSESYLLKQLEDFKTHSRVDALMEGIVTPLSEADMANLAAYFAIQKSSKGVPASGALFALGQTIYRGGKRETGVTACIACHGPKGEGVPLAGFPALASQHAAYISKQLKLFRQHSINIQTGESKSSRVNDYEGMMVNFTKNLTNKEIDAVAAYISSLK
ncbi:Cytochrome c4 [uncultured Gammaproteobacteria bacterium]|jgi:cytochrome c553|nr:Cytochrome c4 [uncultured Gammaproteobacteria bacterium]